MTLSAKAAPTRTLKNKNKQKKKPASILPAGSTARGSLSVLLVHRFCDTSLTGGGEKKHIWSSPTQKKKSYLG